MSGKKNRSAEYNSYIKILEDTKKYIENDWPDWKKSISPIETTSNTYTNLSSNIKHSQRGKSNKD